MPSIFIWKSDCENTSPKMIKYHSGSNWVLEDTEQSSKSYMYIEQIVIPGFNDSVITFHTKQMSTNWVGSDLLEVTEVPYTHIKSDEYGTLEMIGNWMRFTSKYEIDYNYDKLVLELSKIKNWMNEHTHVERGGLKGGSKHNKIHAECHNNKYNKHNNLTPETIHNNFQEFLIKYTL